MSETRSRPKIADVAKLAKTSEAAVSVVVNGRVGTSARISQATQSRIWDAVRELGYAANPAAKSLAGGRNRIIGVFTFEATFPIESRDFYYPFLIGVEAEAAAQGYDLLLIASAADATGRRSLYRNGVNRLHLADGGILLGRHPDRAEIRALAAEGFPYVFIGRRDTPENNISYIAAGYEDATAQIAGHILALGHRRIAYFRTMQEAESSTDRESGYRRMMQAQGLAASTDLICRVEPAQINSALLNRYLAIGVTAFLAEDNAFGEALLQAGEQTGLRCPQDFSIAVLGNSVSFVELPRDWTSFEIPRAAMGREAVTMLLRMLDGDAAALPYRVTLPCAFHAGSTVAAR